MYWSESAGYGHLHPMPTEATLVQSYAVEQVNGYANSICTPDKGRPNLLAALVYRVIYQIGSRTEQGEISNATIVSRLMGARRGRVCSIGLDPLGMLSTVADFGHEVVSVERTAIERDATQAQGIQVLSGTAEQLPPSLEPESFDIVAMIHSLSRTRNPWMAVTNAAALLKPGGHLWIDVPNFRSAAFDILGPAWFHADPGRHLHFFSAQSLAAVIRSTGMEVLQEHHFGYSRQFTWNTFQHNLWTLLYEVSDVSNHVVAPPRPGLTTDLRLFLRTLFSQPQRRHDSVRILARKDSNSRHSALP
jgi:2-polyprenyl-3-methyl-5-hydroxy-6-metoxy-1,4-benzoquinol methylase